LYVRATEIGLQYAITAYDACYVALAEREDVTLVTTDEPLIRALASSPFQVQSLEAFTIPKVGVSDS